MRNNVQTALHFAKNSYGPYFITLIPKCGRFQEVHCVAGIVDFTLKPGPLLMVVVLMPTLGRVDLWKLDESHE